MSEQRLPRPWEVAGTVEHTPEMLAALERMPPLIRRPEGAPLVVPTVLRDQPTFDAVWLHCSPRLLTAGYHCPSGPRQCCDCPDNGVGHDHLVDVSWARKHHLVEDQ